MGLPPLSKIPFILRPQAWLHRRHYGEVLSPIRWWGRIPFIFYLVSMFVGWLERKRSPLDPVVRSLVSARIAQMCLCEFCVDITSMKVAERTGSTDKLSCWQWLTGGKARSLAMKNGWRWSTPKPQA
ncbi:hypothetical protein EIMP300_48870 [Escherichia coli]|uniref:Decarboxylase n=1 Tax=Escherichia coli TaxID=562 RepID=A0A8S0FT06_ECOLX|nr:hypothetical protein EIMP300_48870 [Escherichia coli]